MQQVSMNFDPWKAKHAFQPGEHPTFILALAPER